MLCNLEWNGQSVAMADTILDFLRYGAHPASVSSVAISSASPFLPSLALSASDAPSLILPLLPPFVSNPLAPQAFDYASLDFSDLPHSVLDMEASAAAGSRSQPIAGQDVDMSAGTQETAELDESVTFEISSEKERLKLAIVSLRKRASEFSRRIVDGENPEKVWFQQQKDEGSMWDSDVCISELLCLLPLAVLRCPTLLLPEHIVWGLLTARWGFVLLFSTLINNPLVVREALSLLSQFVSSHQDAFERYARMSLEPSVTQSPVHLPTKYQSNKKAGEPLLHSQRQANVIVNHCVGQALLTFLRLSTFSSSMAFMCREALVRNCTFAGLALHITSEFLHDELTFMSKMIFSAQKTSEWILCYFKTAQKDPVCAVALLVDAAESMLESSFRDSKDQIQSASKDDSCSHHQGSAYHVRKALLADAQMIRQKHGWCGQLHGHLRLYCVMIRAAEMQPTHEEIEFWLKSLSNEFERHPSDSVTCPSKVNGFLCERTLQLGISFFCLVPGLTNSSTRALFHKCLSALLRSNISAELKCSPETQLAVWISVQLLLRRFSDIAMVVREVLGMHVTVHNALMRELHDAAVSAEIISEQSSLVKAVAALRPKGPISNKMKHGCYTLKCLEQLLSSGHFVRFGVDISEAVLHCISVSTEPIHPLLVQIIQTYAEALAVVPQGKPGSQTFRMLPLSRSFLEDSFVPLPSLVKELETDAIESKNSRSVRNMRVRAALASYYMLGRENCLRNMGFEASFESSESLAITLVEGEENWWSNLLARIPFRQLISYMEKEWALFEHLFPQWLSLASVLFPEWLQVPVLLEDLTGDSSHSDALTEGTSGSLFRISGSLGNGIGAENLLFKISEKDHARSAELPESDLVLTSDLVVRTIRNALQEPLPTLQILNFLYCNESRLGVLYKGELLELQMLVIKELVPSLLDQKCSWCLQEKFCSWWLSLQPITRQILIPVFNESILDTTQALQAKNSETGVVTAQIKELVSHVDYQNLRKTYNDFVQEPLTVLACKLEVYRTPVLSILLDILSELLTVNRRVCLGVASDGGREGALKADEVTSALTAQDSAVCQILLEVCIPNTNVGDKIRPGPLLEARVRICRFLSSLLQTNHLLLKLIHFQGYDAQLIPMLVEGVPVMVQCLAFVPELLRQQHQSKQVFAVMLITCIASAYAELPQSRAAVGQAVAHVAFVQHNVCGSSEFLQAVLGAMAQCGSTFPEVAAQVVSILQSCVQSAGPLTCSGPPRDPALQSAALSAFKQLIRQKVLLGEPPPHPTPFATPSQES